MDENILTTIKKLLGISEDEDSFDTDILTLINSCMLGLAQNGIGPTTGYLVIDKDTEWTTLTLSRNDFEPLKTYIYMKVRLMFDPPQSSVMEDAMKRTIDELEWRMKLQVEE